MKNSNLKQAIAHLRRSDKVMQSVITNTELVINNKPKPSCFHALVCTIINQQLSVKAAATIEKRVLHMQGGRAFNPIKLNTMKDNALRGCGLSSNKTRYIKTIAEAVVSKKLNFRKLIHLDDESIRNTLISYPGIGDWSADIFLMNGLGREDIFPVGDLIIRKSIQHHYKITPDSNYDEYISIAENWRPYRSVASFYLWKSFHQK